MREAQHGPASGRAMREACIPWWHLVDRGKVMLQVVGICRIPRGAKSVATLLLVAMPGAPSSFLFLVVWPGAPSSDLAPSSDARSP